MKRIMILGIVCVMLMVIPSIVIAQTQAGQREVTMAGTLTKTEVEGESVTMTMLMGGYGYFISDTTAVGVNTMLMRIDAGDDGATNLLFLDPFVKYHFATESTIVPYVGAHAGFMIFSNDVSETAFSCGVYGGVKNYLTENVSVFAQLDLSRYTIESIDINQTQITVGYSYAF